MFDAPASASAPDSARRAVEQPAEQAHDGLDQPQVIQPAAISAAKKITAGSTWVARTKPTEGSPAAVAPSGRQAPAGRTGTRRRRCRACQHGERRGRCRHEQQRGGSDGSQKTTTPSASISSAAEPRDRASTANGRRQPPQTQASTSQHAASRTRETRFSQLTRPLCLGDVRRWPAAVAGRFAGRRSRRDVAVEHVPRASVMRIKTSCNRDCPTPAGSWPPLRTAASSCRVTPSTR